jgi:hypothetical protein
MCELIKPDCLTDGKFDLKNEAGKNYENYTHHKNT